MVAIKIVIIILFSVLYGIALASKIFTKNETKYKKLSDFADLVFSSACLTSIDFMSHILDINEYIKFLCIAIAFIVIPVVAPTNIPFFQPKKSTSIMLKTLLTDNPNTFNPFIEYIAIDKSKLAPITSSTVKACFIPYSFITVIEFTNIL